MNRGQRPSGWFHRLLRAAGISGWKSNDPVVLAGSTFYIWRQNLLALDGWRVLRFTWAMLTERPDEVVAMIRTVL
jgi:hypothetical protein